LINNRQGGRRRGRGGQRPNSGGQPGNRQENRQRGNAAQLLEKYKSMARDSQLAGDRVQTEYYLQFADHYFRVLSENQRRFDDQRRQRGDDMDDEDGEDAELETADAEEAQDERPARGDRHDRGDRNERSDRSNRRARPQRRDESEEDADEGGSRQINGGETIPFDALPPAIGRDDEGEPAEEEERKPRRRTRAARPAEGEDEVAPAA